MTSPFSIHTDINESWYDFHLSGQCRISSLLLVYSQIFNTHTHTRTHERLLLIYVQTLVAVDLWLLETYTIIRKRQTTCERVNIHCQAWAKLCFICIIKADHRGWSWKGCGFVSMFSEWCRKRERERLMLNQSFIQSADRSSKGKLWLRLKFSSISRI